MNFYSWGQNDYTLISKEITKKQNKTKQQKKMKKKQKTPPNAIV